MDGRAQEHPPASHSSLTAVDTAIRLAFLGLLAYWSLLLISPFVIVGLWGVILAVALYPVFDWLKARLRGQGGLAAGLLTALLLAAVIGPASLLSTALIDNLQHLATRVSEGTLRIPTPAEDVRDWPIVGDRLYQFWNLASTNMAEALDRTRPQLTPFAGTLLSAAASAGIGVLQFIASIIIAGFLFAPAERLVAGARAFSRRMAARQGDHFVTLAGSTIRNVARGVIGIALLQSLLIGIGLLAAEIPAAGLVTMGALVLGILQIGPGVLVLGAIVWAWTHMDAGLALLFTAYMVPAALLDNILKPFVLSHGLATPLLVIFVGVLGGTFAHGLIGLFVGPIVLAVAYDLLLFWVRSPDEAARKGEEGGRTAPP